METYYLLGPDQMNDRVQGSRVPCQGETVHHRGDAWKVSNVSWSVERSADIYGSPIGESMARVSLHQPEVRSALATVTHIDKHGRYVSIENNGITNNLSVGDGFTIREPY